MMLLFVRWLLEMLDCVSVKSSTETVVYYKKKGATSNNVTLHYHFLSQRLNSKMVYFGKLDSVSFVEGRIGQTKHKLIKRVI